MSNSITVQDLINKKDQLNPVVTCECGAKVLKYGMDKHKITSKHIKWLGKQEEQKEQEKQKAAPAPTKSNDYAKMAQDLIKVLEEGITIGDILYALSFVKKERERQRGKYKPTGNPIGRPRKQLELNMGLKN